MTIDPFAPTPEPDDATKLAQKADLDRAARTAGFAMATYGMMPGVSELPRATQDGIALRAGLGLLIGQGLITVKSEDEWPEYISLDVPTWLEPDVAGALDNYRLLLAAMDDVRRGRP